MPAQFTIKAADLSAILKELREVDPGLRRELQKEMRAALRPFARELRANIPAQPPVSGLAVGAEGRRWGPVTPSVKTPLGKRAKKPGFYPVVSMSFRGRGGLGGFYFTELMRQGRSPRGRALVAALNRTAPVIGGLGRFVIPEAKGKVEEPVRLAKEIITRYADKVSRRLR